MSVAITEECIREAIDFIINLGDDANAAKFPVGCEVRHTVYSLGEFQASYTTRNWNEKKEKAMDAATLWKRPPHTVLSHFAGWMRVRDALGQEFKTTYGHWEIVQ